MTTKILWTEGTFVRPQHFQWQERQIGEDLNNRIEGIQPFHWGFRRLTINFANLDVGIFSLDDCAGNFHDGTSFDTALSDELPLNLKLADTVRDAKVFLTVPVRLPNVSEVAQENEHGTAARYQSGVKDVRDLSSKDGKIAPLEVANLKLKLSLEEHPSGVAGERSSDGFFKLAIAHVDEVVGGKIKLKKDFIPTIQYVHVSPYLKNKLSEFKSMLATRANELARRVSTNTGSSGVAEVTDFLLLQMINRLEPVIDGILSPQSCHPRELYWFMISFVGELSTFMRQEKRPPAVLPYNHDELSACFNHVFDEVSQLFTVVLEQIATSIPLSPPKNNIRAARLSDLTLLDEGYLVLAASAQIPSEILRQDLPAHIKIGPGEKIFQLVQSSLPGIAILPMVTAPREIPMHAGFCYFELSKHSTLWDELKHSKGMALHVSGNFPGLEMQLWAIRRR